MFGCKQARWPLAQHFRVPFARLALVLVLWLGALAAPLAAQSPEPELPDFAAWEQLAERTEAALVNRTTPEAELEALRSEIAAFRSQFLAAQSFFRERIAILREQLDALGPPPAEGEVEAPEIAERRADLLQRLAQRQAPLVTAEEALRRADALIRSIDRTLRERQAEALLSLWPTPLDPRNWLRAADALISSLLTVQGEVWNAWLDPQKRAEFIAALPLILVYLGLALVLLVRGRRWMEELTLRFLRSALFRRLKSVAGQLVSLAQIAVPVAGLWLLREAILLSGLGGVTITGLAEGLFAAGVALILARWLSLQIFPYIRDPFLVFRFDDEARQRGRRAALLAGSAVALNIFYGPLIAPETQSEAANAVLRSPLIVLAALALWRIGGIFQCQEPTAQASEDNTAQTASAARQDFSFVDKTILISGKLLKALAVLAPILAAAGYVQAATQISFPTILTLGVAALVVVLQRLVTAVWATVRGDEKAAEGLVPALAGLVLSLGALPFVVLIWGVRATELHELWIRLLEGFRIGETRISPGNILAFFLTFAFGYLITRAVQGALASSVLPRTSLEKGAQKAIVAGIGYAGVVIAALVSFSTAGIDLSGLAIVAGALSVGIGFGLQNIVSNFVSGLILLIERPISEGDWVEVGNTQGIVSRISVRSTVIETFDLSEVIVPNTDLITQRVTNFTKTNRMGRVIVPISVAYGTDTRKVERILREIAEAHPIIALDPPPAVLFSRFGADGLEFEVRAILKDVNFKLRVASDLNHQIAKRFQAEGIEIPFTQRDLWFRNPEALAAALRGEPIKVSGAGAAMTAAGAGAVVAGALAGEAADAQARPLSAPEHPASPTEAEPEGDETDEET